jgi:hypothetical protein
MADYRCRGPPPRLVSRLLLAATALLLSLINSVEADCECGYATTIENDAYVFTDLIETDFTRLSDISTNTDWVRQEFNISNAKARGSFGEMFAVQNIFTEAVSGQRSADSGAGRASNGQPAGLQLVVRESQVQEMVPVAEIDTARLDVVFGSYRAGLKLTDVSGTCSAFFWVSERCDGAMRPLSACARRAKLGAPAGCPSWKREIKADGWPWVL